MDDKKLRIWLECEINRTHREGYHLASLGVEKFVEAANKMRECGLMMLNSQTKLNLEFSKETASGYCKLAKYRADKFETFAEVKTIISALFPSPKQTLMEPVISQSAFFPKMTDAIDRFRTKFSKIYRVEEIESMNENEREQMATHIKPVVSELQDMLDQLLPSRRYKGFIVPDTPIRNLLPERDAN